MMNGKILVVEDFADSRELLSLLLKRSGYEVFEACDGEEALKKAADIHPDLIVMDISMPRMDGLETTTHLKSNAQTKNIPVVIMTAHTQRSLISDALEAGAVDVLIKPLSFLALGETFGKYIQSQNPDSEFYGRPTTVSPVEL